ncbi:MAG: hypothetical protein V3U04_02025 [Candidatus Aerophobetes bacterium]
MPEFNSLIQTRRQDLQKLSQEIQVYLQRRRELIKDCPQMGLKRPDALKENTQVLSHPLKPLKVSYPTPHLQDKPEVPGSFSSPSLDHVRERQMVKGTVYLYRIKESYVMGKPLLLL